MRATTFLIAFIGFVWGVIPPFGPTSAVAQGEEISARFQRLTRESRWRLTASLPLKFNTHHPQGMVRIGERFHVSSVEVTEPTRRFASPQAGLDRSTGAGIGHLFSFDATGNLTGQLRLGEGAIYHPGGIDFDGRFIWVSVAEYRPRSHSIVYRVDPATLQATEVFRYPDHIGAIVFDPEQRVLHGVSWGSRDFYRWPLDAQGRVENAATPPEQLRRRNPSFYIDYQDAKFVGRGQMLCAGLSTYQGNFRLGGMELVDLESGRPLHQLPVELWTKSGLPMTQNPFWVETTADGLRVWFLPEDRQSTLYTYEVSVP